MCMSKQSEVIVPSQDEYIAMYGQAVRVEVIVPSGASISRFCMDNSHQLRDKTGRRDLGKPYTRTY